MESGDASSRFGKNSSTDTDGDSQQQLRFDCGLNHNLYSEVGAPVRWYTVRRSDTGIFLAPDSRGGEGNIVSRLPVGGVE